MGQPLKTLQNPYKTRMTKGSNPSLKTNFIQERIFLNFSHPEKYLDPIVEIRDLPIHSI
jgi:hypothetical protein